MGARGLLFAAAAAMSLLVFSAAASAASIEIVNQRSGQRISVQMADLAGSYDVDADYAVRSASGTSFEHVRGISLAHLMEVAKADETYGAIRVARPDGSQVTVSKTQMIAPGLRPVIYAKGDAIVFLRPSSGAADLNAGDLIASTSAIGLTQVDLGAVSVKASVSKLKAKVGEKLTFSATATGAAAGAEYEFTWVFRDGRSASGAQVTHSFRRRGSYQVIVTAKEKGASTSSSPDWVTVQVGAKVKSDKQRSGGGTNDFAGAPTSGASDGSSGSGDVATGGAAKRKKAGEPQPRPVAEPDLPVVTGQVLSASSDPLAADSGLAARSGQQDAVKVSSGSGFGARGGIAIAAVLVLALGLLSEFGVFGALRRWRRELRGEAA